MDQPFLVKLITDKHTSWIDINTGEEYDELQTDFESANHGLCEKYGRKVLKSYRFHKILISKQPPKTAPTQKPIAVPFFNADKKKEMWIFDPLDLSEIKSGDWGDIDELAIRICAPVEAVENVFEKIGGTKFGRINRHHIERGRKGSSCAYSRRRKNGS